MKIADCLSPCVGNEEVSRLRGSICECADGREALRLMSQLGVNELRVTAKDGRVRGRVRLEWLWASLQEKSARKVGFRDYVEML